MVPNDVTHPTTSYREVFGYKLISERGDIIWHHSVPVFSPMDFEDILKGKFTSATPSLLKKQKNMYAMKCKIFYQPLVGCSLEIFSAVYSSVKNKARSLNSSR